MPWLGLGREAGAQLKMSYSRKCLESDVYVFDDSVDWVCHECALSGGANHKESTPPGMLAHLLAHRERGHMVPQSAMDRLASEPPRNH